MNTFLEALLSIAFGIGSNKLLKQYGYAGKAISILVLVISLLFFTYTPLMMNDLEDGDLIAVPAIEGGLGAITYEDMYDNITIAFRTTFSVLIFLLGAFAITLS